MKRLKRKRKKHSKQKPNQRLKTSKPIKPRKILPLLKQRLIKSLISKSKRVCRLESLPSRLPSHKKRKKLKKPLNKRRNSRQHNKKPPLLANSKKLLHNKHRLLQGRCMSLATEQLMSIGTLLATCLATPTLVVSSQ